MYRNIIFNIYCNEPKKNRLKEINVLVLAFFFFFYFFFFYKLALPSLLNIIDIF